MKKIFVAYCPDKDGAGCIMTKNEQVIPEILKKRPFIKFEEVEIEDELFNSVTEETIYTKL
jgi:hypothetical protein